MWSARWRRRLVAEPVATAVLATGSGAADTTRRPCLGVPPPRAATHPSIRSWELVVHNFFIIETEAAFRRCEWERGVAAAAQAARARPENGRKRWSSRLPHLAFARLRSLLRATGALHVVVGHRRTGEQRAKTLEGGPATVN